ASKKVVRSCATTRAPAAASRAPDSARGTVAASEATVRPASASPRRSAVLLEGTASSNLLETGGDYVAFPGDGGLVSLDLAHLGPFGARPRPRPRSRNCGRGAARGATTECSRIPATTIHARRPQLRVAVAVAVAVPRKDSAVLNPEYA